MPVGNWTPFPDTAMLHFDDEDEEYFVKLLGPSWRPMEQMRKATGLRTFSQIAEHELPNGDGYQRFGKKVAFFGPSGVMRRVAWENASFAAKWAVITTGGDTLVKYLDMNERGPDEIVQACGGEFMIA